MPTGTIFRVSTRPARHYASRPSKSFSKSFSPAEGKRTSPAATRAGASRPSLPAVAAEVEYDAPQLRSDVLLAKAELGAHLQHGGVFDQDVAVDAAQALCSAVRDHTLHQQPAEPVPLQPRAHQDGELRSLFVELVSQAHQPEQLSRVGIQRNEGHFVPVVEMLELLQLGRAELGNMRKKPQAQILGADVAQKGRIKRHVFRTRPANQNALAALERLVPLIRTRFGFFRHRRAVSLRAGGQIRSRRHLPRFGDFPSSAQKWPTGLARPRSSRYTIAKIHGLQLRFPSQGKRKPRRGRLTKSHGSARRRRTPPRKGARNAPGTPGAADRR